MDINKDINFELYKIFYHTASAGNFSDAARKLFITQSAVSQSIKSLEEKIGSQLFIRKSRSINLTAEGEILFKHIRQAYNFIKAAESKIGEMQNLNSGEIRIGASDTVCKYHLIPYLKKYNHKYPNIKISVINRTSQNITTLLKSGIIDLGIVTMPVEDKAIKAVEFTSVEDILVASSKYTDLKDRIIGLEQLLEYPLLMLEKNSATRRNFDRYLEEKALKISPEIELESVDLLVEFAKIGLGIAHVLRESAATSIHSNELFEINTKENFPKRILGIITTKDVPLSMASKEFIRLINGHSD